MILNHQYARHSSSESEDLGAVTPREAVQSFDEFDWSGETERAEELKGTAPTLSLVTDRDRDRIWVSSYRAPQGLQFVSECLFPDKVKSLFGLRTKDGVVSLHTDHFSKEEARKAIELYAAKDYESLRVIYEGA